jgi:Fe-Mn family superoxide dismutase
MQYYLRMPLRYDAIQLAPYIDEETMYEHYDKHYKKYTDNLNEAVIKENLEFTNIETLLSRHSNLESIRNNGGGYYNHLLYFQNISPFQNTFSTASQNIKELIINNFGSYENFRNIFKDAGLKLFGSGWVWLIYYKGQLKIAQTKNQDNPVMSINCINLLGMDVWEHAYYLKHKSNREAYINDFFDIIDWKIVSMRGYECR